MVKKYKYIYSNQQAVKIFIRKVQCFCLLTSVAVFHPFSYVFCSGLFVCHRWLTWLCNLLAGWVSAVFRVLVLDSYVCLWLYSVINVNSELCSPCFCSGIRFPSLWVVWISNCSYGISRFAFQIDFIRVIMSLSRPYSCRLNHYSLGYHITNRQSRHITPAHLKSAYTTQRVLASSWRWTY